MAYLFERLHNREMDVRGALVDFHVEPLFLVLELHVALRVVDLLKGPEHEHGLVDVLRLAVDHALFGLGYDEVFVLVVFAPV